MRSPIQGEPPQSSVSLIMMTIGRSLHAPVMVAYGVAVRFRLLGRALTWQTQV